MDLTDLFLDVPLLPWGNDDSLLAGETGKCPWGPGGGQLARGASTFPALIPWLVFYFNEFSSLLKLIIFLALLL